MGVLGLERSAGVWWGPLLGPGAIFGYCLVGVSVGTDSVRSRFRGGAGIGFNTHARDFRTTAAQVSNARVGLFVHSGCFQGWFGGSICIQPLCILIQSYTRWSRLKRKTGPPTSSINTPKPEIRQKSLSFRQLLRHECRSWGVGFYALKDTPLIQPRTKQV